MRRELRWRLTLLLGGTILLAGMIAAGASFLLAYSEAKEFQDDMLRQIALLQIQGPGVSAATEEAPGGVARDGLHDSDARISVIVLPAAPRPDWLAKDLPLGLHTVATREDRLRIFIHGDGAGKTVVVAQPTEIRDEIALNSALHTFIPLVFLLPLIAWLILRIVKDELGPVKRLAGYLDAQPANQPSPLPETNIPNEIVPFVQAINRLLERVTDLMGQQRRFIADAAHELRSPLAALLIQAQNLGQSGSLESMRERVVQLQAGIERARKLTEQLLNLARIQAGAEERSAVDISELARQLIAEYLPLAESKEIDLGLDEGERLRLFAGRGNLYLILKNGLENALKYTPKGGEVTLKIAADGERAIFEVVDNGPGIPAAERERVFAPFYRVAGTPCEGDGLGLAIAMEAAKSQGGEVFLLEGPGGRGVIFRYSQLGVMAERKAAA